MKKALLALASTLTLSAIATQVQSTDLGCEITIVGGGASGVHTAMRLGKKHGKNVCLFEKESKLGGRLNDIRKDPKSTKVLELLSAVDEL